MSNSNITDCEHWILVYTKSRQEERAQENLEKQGFDTFLPRISSDQGSSKLIEAMFPRYLFLKINQELTYFANARRFFLCNC